MATTYTLQDGRKLPEGTAFDAVIDGKTYRFPANWLGLATDADLVRHRITKLVEPDPDPPPPPTPAEIVTAVLAREKFPRALVALLAQRFSATEDQIKNALIQAAT